MEITHKDHPVSYLSAVIDVGSICYGMAWQGMACKDTDGLFVLVWYGTTLQGTE